MSDVEDLVREIAARHGVAVGRDDPILILHTLNERLAADTAAAQEALLRRWQEEQEIFLARWEETARRQAQSYLTAALEAAAGAMDARMGAMAEETVMTARQGMEAAVKPILKQLAEARQAAILNLVAALLTLTAVAIATVFVFGR